MDERLKQEKKENFEAWVETIDERLFDWFNHLAPENKNDFDYSIDSLEKAEKYLIERFTLEDLRNPLYKYEIDAVASYIIKVFAMHWPNSKFVIELDDEKNILFNRPAVITDPAIGMAFSPYQIIPSTVNLKRIGGLRKIFEAKLRQYKAKYT